MIDTEQDTQATQIPIPVRRPSPTLVREMAARIPPAPPGVLSPPSVIAAVAAQIAERFHPAHIVLFGSRAYGHPTPESDVDLMVVMDTDQSLFTMALEIERAVGLRCPDPRLDVKVRTPAQIRLGLREHDFFIQDVMLKGITLYERSDVGTLDEQEEPAPQPGLKRATREWLAMAEADAGGPAVCSAVSRRIRILPASWHSKASRRR